MNRIFLSIAVAASLAAPALADDRGWNGGRPGYSNGNGRGGYGGGYRGYDRNDYRGYDRGRRGFDNRYYGRIGYGRPAYYPPAYGYGRPAFGRPVYGRPVYGYGGYYAPPIINYRPVFVPPAYFGYGAPIVYGGYAQPFPVPVPIAYGGPSFGGPGYYDPCRSTGAGAVIGAIAGGLIGNGIAGPYDRGLGTVVGAGLGAVTGTAIERNQRCGY